MAERYPDPDLAPSLRHLTRNSNQSRQPSYKAADQAFQLQAWARA